MKRQPLPKIMPPCEIKDCTAKVYQRTSGRFLCVSHAQKMRKYGEPELNHPRFRRKLGWVESNSSYTQDDCLKWPFDVSDHGRGRVQVNGRTMSAPRYMCILAHGSPPTPDHHAAHSCGNGHLGCMNPNHLSWKTAKENEADKVDHGTLRKGTAINTNKLSEDDVRAIRSMGGKVKGTEIAKAWGVTPSAISSILSRKSWAWLE